MELAEFYQVPPLAGQQDIVVSVPGSKSITNRALILAALGNKRCVLKGVLFSDDSRAMMECLVGLGYRLEIDPDNRQVAVTGENRRIPRREAVLNVQSAGTAARFLTVLLALAGGHYTLESSDQMKRRPMEPLITVLRQMGTTIVCPEAEGHFPLLIGRRDESAYDVSNHSGDNHNSDNHEHNHEHARPLPASAGEVTVDTGTSSQFASALLLAGAVRPAGLGLRLTGTRTDGAYIGMTLRLMEQFGLTVIRDGDRCLVPPCQEFGREEYQIEPDVSGACYFYACAPLFRTDVMVRQVHLNSLQGDIRFVRLMERLGCRTEEDENGLWVRGRAIEAFPGVTVDMKDFADQTMTMAAVAVFAATETVIQNIGHIRHQESDRVGAIVTELNRIGIKCEVTDDDGIRIVPGPVKGGTVETYEDHRMAMAFALIGLKTGRIIIKNPGCCAKTFENFFELIHGIAEPPGPRARSAKGIK